MNLSPEEDDESPQVGFGWTPSTPEQHAKRVSADAACLAARRAAPVTKAVIELTGPGIDGLSDATSFLFMAGWPPQDGVTSGEYVDGPLGLSVKWRLEPT